MWLWLLQSYWVTLIPVKAVHQRFVKYDVECSLYLSTVSKLHVDFVQFVISFDTNGRYSNVEAYCSCSVILFWLPRKWCSLNFVIEGPVSLTTIEWINCMMIMLVMNNYFQADSAKPCCWHWWFLTVKTCDKYSTIWTDIPGQITHNSAKPKVNRCRTIWQRHLQFECSWKERQHCTGIA